MPQGWPGNLSADSETATGAIPDGRLLALRLSLSLCDLDVSGVVTLPGEDFEQFLFAQRHASCGLAGSGVDVEEDRRSLACLDRVAVVVDDLGVAVGRILGHALALVAVRDLARRVVALVDRGVAIDPHVVLGGLLPVLVRRELFGPVVDPEALFERPGARRGLTVAFDLGSGCGDSGVADLAVVGLHLGVAVIGLLARLDGRVRSARAVDEDDLLGLGLAGVDIALLLGFVTLGIGVAGLGLVTVIALGVGTAVLIRVGLGVCLRVGFDRVAISVSGAVVTLGRVGDDFPVAPVAGDFIIGARQVGQVDVIGIRCLGGHGLLSRVVCQRRGGGHEDCGGEQ